MNEEWQCVCLCVCMLRGCWGGEVTSCQDTGVKFILPARGDADRTGGEGEVMNPGEEGKYNEENTLYRLGLL